MQECIISHLKLLFQQSPEGEAKIMVFLGQDIRFFSRDWNGEVRSRRNSCLAVVSVVLLGKFHN
jgi:hypothetical protein